MGDLGILPQPKPKDYKIVRFGYGGVAEETAAGIKKLGYEFWS
ncbi:hypothetical protein COLO4_25754 [Corchorus olitorius]|uniref:Uncharacterized protein n=1 Tax=Corchorus olitorius TaxID=93759 RepID=A0A1R3I0F1_9ROSI|nr:hypothetical protein COLO4_25754 [Corchorus olitorius]